MAYRLFEFPRIVLLLSLAVLFFCACGHETPKTLPDHEEVSHEERVNINSGSIEQLSTLDGIGRARAIRIIEFRREFGRFEIKEELMLVDGIGEKLFLKIEEGISVR